MSDGIVTTSGAESRPLKSQEETEWGRGWTIVAVAFAAYVVGSAAMFFTFGLFLGSLTAEFQWSRQAVSGSLAISGVMFAIASPLTGRLADRLGIKPVILFCTTTLAVLFASQGLLTHHLWHFYTLAILIGAGHTWDVGLDLCQGGLQLVRQAKGHGTLRASLRHGCSGDRRTSLCSVLDRTPWMAQRIFPIRFDHVTLRPSASCHSVERLTSKDTGSGTRWRRNSSGPATAASLIGLPQFCILDLGVGFVRNRRHLRRCPVASGANVDR